ncbi:MAG: hypothetical protein HXS48_11840 [Theionarchaea archaeon]|nr:hypothetical protein [Theionarchaea archaeon]
MKRKALAFILVFFITAVNVPPSASQSNWTVMVFMDGDNDLESAALDDLNEMEYAGSTVNVNIVVQIDRISGYDSSNGNWTTTRRYYVTQDPGGYNSTVVSTLISDLGEQNMGDPNTLIDFVNWAQTTYPADNYLLVLWDHGDGWKTRSYTATQKGVITRIQKREPVKGICYDDTDNDYLTTTDLGTAFDTITNGGVAPVDVVGFDACLMAMVEIDYEISPYALYCVGSEETEPGDGWDYQTTMNWLTTNPGSTPDQVSAQIVTDYMNFYGSGGYETQSAVDLSQIAALAAAVNTLAVDLTSNMAAYKSDIQNVRDQVEDSPWEPDFVDLYHFAQLIHTEISDPTIQTDAVNVMNAVTTAVITEGHGASHPNFHGISIYFPYGGNDYLSRYETDTQFALDTGWDEFLTAYYYAGPPPVYAVAVIDDDRGSSFTHVEGYYTDALDALGVSYDYHNTSTNGAPSLAYLQAHSVVIWFTGEDFTQTLTPTDENNLILYLNGGGTLFFCSQDYVWDLKLDGRYPSTFLRNYLHTTSEVEDTGVNTVSGVAGNQVGNGLGPYQMCWNSPSTCTFTDYADWVTKDSSSEYAFYNESNQYVAITYAGGYKVVFFAFMFEAIRSASDRQEVMERILDFFGSAGPTFGSLADLFSTNSFFVAGDQAYCTDVLGSAKIAFGLGQAGTSENPEGRTDLLLTQTEHDTGNLIPVGGPAINPVADEFDSIFGITFTYNAGISFEISCEGHSIYLDLAQYPSEDICIVYLGEDNSQNVMLVWGYGWQGSYAGSTFMGDPSNWQTYQDAHMLMLRWTDSNGDGLVQTTEITVEHAI